MRFGRSGNDGCFLKTCFLQFFSDHFHDKIRLTFRKVRFCHDHDQVGHSQVFQDLKMFFRLWHPAIICSNDQKTQIHRPDPGHHIFHEIFVTGYIHDSKVILGGRVFWIPQQPLSKSEIDRDTPSFFLG